jgi:hypothetical protein
VNSFWIFVLAILGISLLFAAFNAWCAHRRTIAWQEIAQKPGMQFLGSRNDLLAEYGHMQTLQVGRMRRLYNVISVDSRELLVLAGDFRYQTRTGKNRHTHHRTICVLRSDRMNLQSCSLRPERKLLDSIGSMLGGQDIDFAEDPEFSDAYVLQGDDETAIRGLFNAEVRAWFAERVGQRFHFEARGNALVFHTGGLCRPSDVPRLMDQALQIMKLLTKQS